MKNAGSLGGQASGISRMIHHIIHEYQSRTKATSAQYQAEGLIQPHGSAS